MQHQQSRLLLYCALSSKAFQGLKLLCHNLYLNHIKVFFFPCLNLMKECILCSLADFAKLHWLGRYFDGQVVFHTYMLLAFSDLK